jgi:hypothetical protein
VARVPTGKYDPASDPERQAAAWVLSLGGAIDIIEGGKQRKIRAGDGLPQTAFELTSVDVRGPKVTDAGLAVFKECRNLTYLIVQGPLVTDTGLANFKNCTQLTYLNLEGTEVTDAGLEYFKECKLLTGLGVPHTHLTDAALDRLAGFTKLRGMNIKFTRITEVGSKKLAAALPTCKVEWEGGGSGRSASSGLVFNGKSDYVEIPGLTRAQQTPLTIELWVTPGAGKRPETQLLARLVGAADARLLLGETRLAGMIVRRLSGDTFDYFGPTAEKTLVAAGKTVHLAYVIDDGPVQSEQRLYIDGRLAASKLGLPLKSGGTVNDTRKVTYLGGAPIDMATKLGTFFEGQLGEVRVSRTARYAKDFTPPAGFEADAGTLALYRMNEGQGSKLTDASGNGYHGNIVGAKWVKTNR